jgi:hypothetical protein
MGKQLIDILMPLIAAIAGTLIGGFITYKVTKASDERRIANEVKVRGWER